MIEKIIDGLNPSQREAATTIDGPILILAGAGSGKTKTITARLAYLLSIGIDPANTLTLTFTNKAAEEMRNRALGMIGASVTPPLLCTFHKFGLIFLKLYIHKLGRKNSFSVIDSDDKIKVLKPFCKEIAASVASNAISNFKNNLLYPHDVQKAAQDAFQKELGSIYAAYNDYLERNNLVDFDDLLLLPLEILRVDRELANEVSQKYLYITVDEYQDTNTLQFELLKKLCSSHNNICVVGDDDQSIYSFRGAKVENILSFENTFAGTKVVKLEQNYRSTAAILSVANALISNNQNRYDKKLIPTRESGERVEYRNFADEKEEAKFVSKKIKELISKGVPPTEIAVLFRVNAISRAIEEGLRSENIPYSFVGGTKFYERQEIRDAIAYLRLISNSDDNLSIYRIINRPKRGIGKTTLEKLEALSLSLKLPIFELISNELYADILAQNISKKAIGELKNFAKTIEELRVKKEESPITLLEEFEDIVGLKKFYQSIPNEEERAQNLDEFYGSIKEHFRANPSDDIEEYLNNITIQSGLDEADFFVEQVPIMTVHASKGLEFKVVFVVALEEGFFPVSNERCDLEEERRLCYVAFTRAKDKLYLSSCTSRFVYGKREYPPVSRFVEESGILGVRGEVNKRGGAFAKNDLVKHKIFGFGRVLEVSGSGASLKLKINFGGTQRDILASFVEKVV